MLAFTRWSDESIRPACEKGHSEAFFVHLRPDLSKILGLTRSRIGLAYRKLVVVFDHARFLATPLGGGGRSEPLLAVRGAVCGNFIRYPRQRNYPAAGFYQFGSPGRLRSRRSITPDDLTFKEAAGPVERCFFRSVLSATAAQY